MIYRFGQFVLDTSRFQLSRDGEAVPTEPRVLRLIAYLIENRDRAVSRTELLDRLWDSTDISDNSLSVSIRMARSTLGDAGRRQGMIRTLPRFGYRFVADVDASAAKIFEGRGTTREEEPSSSLDSLDAELLSRPSIVVLPFLTIDEAPESNFLAQGLTHDVTTRIGRTRSLFVIARGTAFQFDSDQPDVCAIGKKLGVRYVVHGAVQRYGRKIRVTASLANTATREEIWSEYYERAIGDFAALQEELAGRIVGTLQSEVERSERLRSLLIPSTDLDAWAAYHRGCWHMYRFRPEDVGLAERFFRQSIDLEPTVPRPYAGMSFVCFERAFLGIDDNAATCIQGAFDYAQQALEIDPMDPMAHWAMSRAYLLQGELEASRKLLETAIDLNPSYAIAQYSLGWIGLQLGDNEMCVKRIDMARKLSPYDPLKFAMLGVYALNLALMGRTEEAVVIAKQGAAQPNAHYQALAFAALSHALDGQLRTGVGYLRRVRAIVPGYSSGDFFTVFQFRRGNDVDRIKRAFAELEVWAKAN